MANDKPGKSPRLSRLRPVAALGALAFVGACASELKPVQVGEPNAPPTNYRADILAYLRTYLNDPTGVRDAFITEPTLRAVPGFGVGQGIGQRTVAVERYMVCIRFNAKRSDGRYEGTRDRVIVFLAGQLDTMAPARGDQCKEVNWVPFPELEKLRRT
jgi:hypothetical protein